MNSTRWSLLIFTAFLLVFSAETVLAQDLSLRQKLILQVPENHKLEGEVQVAGDKIKSRVKWQVTHTSDFGPVEVVEAAHTSAKVLIFSVGEELRGAVLLAEFFGPFVPVVITKVGADGNLQQTGGMGSPSPQDLKELQEMSIRTIQDVLGFFRIRSDDELASYIKSQKF